MSAQGFFPLPSGSSQPQASNQYFSTLPSMPNPGVSTTARPLGQSPSLGNPSASSFLPTQSTPGYGSGAFDNSTLQGANTSSNLGHGIISTGQQYPGLGQGLVNYLGTQLGQGLAPYAGSTPLPTGGQTAPGALSAPLNPVLQQLIQSLTGGQSSLPGGNTLNTIANEGISALPEWQSMIAAMNQNTQQNQAQLQEQFASMGALAGSPFGTAMSNFQQQTNLDQNALLGQLQQQNILQGQIPVAEGLQAGQTALASGLQSLDQNAIQQALQQFQTDQPQNNPLLSMIAQLSTLYPPTTKTPTGFQSFTGLLGSLGGLGSVSSTGGSDPSTSVSF